MPHITLITFNVNGIRAAISKGFNQWLQQVNPDIVCLQEVKALEEQVDTQAWEKLGYRVFWNAAEKKGYSGVAVLSKIVPQLVTIGCNHPLFDSEGRVISLQFEGWNLVNCYFPSGTSGDERQQVKYQFLDYLYTWIHQQRPLNPNTVLVGDYNIAHTEQDIHNAKSNQNSSGFLPEERQWMTQFLASGFTDSFRFLNPSAVAYSWWTFRANARANNKGWRIDYICTTNTMQSSLQQCSLLTDIAFSDHCPVQLTFDPPMKG